MSRCPECAVESPEGLRFCGHCGAALSVDARPDRRPDAVDAERRQLTVMFCDLVGSTALSERLDPEDLRDIVRDYQRVSGEVIDRFGGYVAQYLGDGLLVYFGYPQAYEDAPRRAVHAGLGILDAVSSLSDRVEKERNLRLGVRVGIHTGEVVAGEIGTGRSQERLALGQTPNLAARLHAAADENTVVVSESTYRLVRAFFICELLGPLMFKGLSRPVVLHRVLGETGVKSRFEDAVQAGLRPLVGRERELELLVNRFSEAVHGAGQVVLLEAEAGIGKSRLLQALKDAIAGEPVSWWRCGSSSHSGDTALLPIIELLEKIVRIERADRADVKIDRLRAWLEPLGVQLSDALPLLASLLSIPLDDRDAVPGLSPQQAKARTLELLVSIVRRSAHERPMVLVVEDLHWIDPSTIEFLNLAVASVPQSRVLLVLTFRPSFSAPWSAGASVQRLTLDRLTDAQVEALAHAVAGGMRLPADVVAEIVGKTDGVPLFVEELTRMVVESGQVVVEGGQYVLSGPLSSLDIPATLQDSLMARLDRLHDLKELAQIAAVLGREFSFEMLRAVYPEASGVADRLTRLVDAELLFQEGALPRATYTFKHALIQDAAYASLLKSKRRHYHEQVARTLERAFPAMIETRPELAAHHFAEAGLDDAAINYWRRAGEIALGRSANLEAINHLNKALTLLTRLPESFERDRRELALQTLIGPALNTTRGYASPDVERTYRRARQLCDRIGETQELFWIARGQWAFYLVRGDLAAAREIADQLRRIALKHADPALLLESLYVLGTSKYWIGDLAGAREDLEQYACTDVAGRRAGTMHTGQDSGVITLSELGWVRWLQGSHDEALRRGEEAIALAKDISHPLSVTMALYFQLWVHQYRRETAAVTAMAHEVIARSREHGLFYDALANLFVGWALATDGSTDADAQEGIRLMQQCLDMNRASGARLAHTYYLSLLLEIYVRRGDAEHGRRVLDEAFESVKSTGETFWLAELHRLGGELELVAGQGSDQVQARRAAEVAFRTAIEIARGQGAVSLERRAAASLDGLTAGPITA